MFFGSGFVSLGNQASAGLHLQLIPLKMPRGFYGSQDLQLTQFITRSQAWGLSGRDHKHRRLCILHVARLQQLQQRYAQCIGKTPDDCDCRIGLASFNL